MLEPFHTPGVNEAGCDEAGRGALAGPVCAAAVILPDDYRNTLLNDSKKLSSKQRESLREEIESVALDWAVAMIDNVEIDKINILKASIFAMHRALDQLKIIPGAIIIDGNKFYPYKKIPHKCFVKGDGRYNSIAAASILAKTHRDRYMKEIDKSYPLYGWKKNKGYPTTDHRNEIATEGISPYHRKTFRLLDEQMSLSF